MDQLKKFPQKLDYQIGYTPPFIRHSVDDVFNTIFIAALLVIVVVLVFIRTGTRCSADHGHRGRSSAHSW